MNINTANSTIFHMKSAIQNLTKDNELPFSNVLSVQSINEQLNDVTFRARVFSPDVTVFAFLSQVLGQDQSCQAAVAQVIAQNAKQEKAILSANTSAYCQARARLPEALLSNLAKESAKDLEEQARPEWLWRGRHIKIPDGTTVSMPDTSENQAAYSQHPSQKPGIGFPIARLVGVFSLATGALLDLAITSWSGKKTGEHALLRQLMHVFQSGDIVLRDAYYASFFLIAMFIKMQVDVVFPIHACRGYDFRRGARLGKRDHLVQWKKPRKPEWMDEQTYAEFPDNITIREGAITDAKRGYRTKRRILVTTLINSKQVTLQDLVELYGYRWFVELDLRSIKEIMNMDILRSKTPMMVHKEIWAHILAYNLIRKIMIQAAVIHQRNPREMSFKLALQMVFAFRQTGIFSERDEKIYAYFTEAITHKVVGNRSSRSEPRMVKRRPKAFPRLQKPRDFYCKVA